MGNLYDYFAAQDDETAAGTLEDSPDPNRFEVIDVKGIDPAVQLGTLEALLRGIAYAEVTAQPRHSMLISNPGAESRWVVTLTDTLRDALADATAEQLVQVAVPWSHTEEFSGRGDADLLADLLGRFADLARNARARHDRLYCWMSL